MKFCAAILLLVVSMVVADDDWAVQTNTNLVEYRNLCVAKYDITEEQITKFKAWNFEDTELTHNYIHCVFVKMGLFDDVSGFNEDRLFRQLNRNGGADETEVRAGIKKCLAETTGVTDVSLKAYKGLKCFGTQYTSLIQTSIKKD